MPAHQQRRGWLLLDFQFLRALNKPLLRFRGKPLLSRKILGVASERIRLGHAIKQIEFTLSRQPSKRTVANFIPLFEELAWLQMVSDQRENLSTDVVAVEAMDIQPRQKTFRGRHSRFLMTTRTQAAFKKLGRWWFAEVVGDGGKHYGHLFRIRQVVD